MHSRHWQPIQLACFRLPGVFAASPSDHPQGQGLQVGLLLMMQTLMQHSSSSKKAAAAIPPSAASPLQGKRSQKGKQQQHQQQAQEEAHEGGGARAAPADDMADWLPELMASLCEKVRALRSCVAWCCDGVVMRRGGQALGVCLMWQAAVASPRVLCVHVCVSVCVVWR
jgi:hypothetical protein